MIPDLSGLFSKNALNMKRSLIRELLKLSRRPDIISFAGGMPDPQTFPVEELADISAQVLREKGATTLQYGPTEGEPALREALASWLTRNGWTSGPRTSWSPPGPSRPWTSWPRS